MEKGITLPYYQTLLEDITSACKRIFSDGLTGVYLHGSMTMGCFNPKKSDIDLIIVVEKDISDEQKTEFMKEVVEFNKIAPKKGLELSVVKRAVCKPFVYPTPFELHFSPAYLGWFTDNPADYVRKMKGGDKDLAAHFTIIRNYGVVLYGERIDAVFGEVPRKDYMDSIWLDIKEAREEISENPVYIILNLCRAAAFLEEGAVVSKKQGGEWGLRNIPEEYHALILKALESYESEEAKTMCPDAEKAERFSAYMLQRVSAGTIERL